MYSIRRKLIIHVTIIIVIVLLLTIIVLYMSFRSFMLDLIAYFPTQLPIYLQQRGVGETYFRMTTENAVFGLFMRHFQSVFIFNFFVFISIIAIAIFVMNKTTKHVLKDLNFVLLMTNGHFPQEMTQVYEQLQFYAQQVNEMEEQQQQFQGYASHELRNELAKLQGLYVQHQVNTPEILAQHEHIAQNIEDLLVLSGISESVLYEQVDVIMCIASVVDRFSSRARIELRYDEMVEFQIQGKKTWIVRAITNVIDNAIRYSLDGHAYVKVQRVENYIIMTTSNAIADQTIDRFPLVTNNGIGLKLVDRVMKVLKGAYYYEIDQGQVRVILTFPC